ncbi:carbohydrate-binding module family 50 [Nemania sp. NC0429]|nr:carbohydrate-binding module family 50 [Nemania sp. NC0429]
MKLFQAPSRQRRDAFSFLLSLTYASLALATTTGTCKPWTWTNSNLVARAAEPTVTFVPSGDHIFKAGAAVVAGDLVYRDTGWTYADVSSSTYNELADRYEIPLEVFFILNPGLDRDCGNIKPYTIYCVRRFIEPLRAYDAKFGPPNNNATCAGTDAQCCNAETWTCGNSEEDCARGTCYEGYCAGHRVYTTDGTCGYRHGYRRCAGKWGDCCNMDGKCGTGEAFCGWGTCSSGNCTMPDGVLPTETRGVFSGNTTDGTCGGEKNNVCSELYGLCCNKDGKCGPLESDCGEGCQPRFGQCGPGCPPWDRDNKCSSALPTTSPPPEQSVMSSG